ncbi:hypothetical protein K450DRAFT_258408 [Umbelopsis ramanniana AG]|uniref:RRM domain-containing protein n=1 Tax=Umbelopsis ramanniana AG TaxID=1314678 RepID=A0AAD5H943_UMBRA|nr:uncharacterized protein K450DRAFT_258408 [Umbelopsis ramanniana AG]KAI8576090.1 hypothetical protein K450DRAFT_258408 [Umbelopsis ramanniana AG]
MLNVLFSLMPLYVHNLPARSYSPALKNLIEPYGRIRYIEERNGYAYVEMHDERNCRTVLDRCDGVLFKGATIRVRFTDRDDEILPHDDIPLNHTCQVCTGIGHTAIECPTSRHRAIAASLALAHGLERPRGNTGDTNTTNFSLHSRHRSDEMRVERPPIRRPLSGDLLDHHHLGREYSTRINTNRHSFNNLSAYDRPIPREFPMSSRSTTYLNMNRDQRGIPDGPRYKDNRSSARFNNQHTQNRPGRSSSLQDYRRTSREIRTRQVKWNKDVVFCLALTLQRLCRSRTPPPRGPAKRNGPVPRPYGEEGHSRNGMKRFSQSRTVHKSEDMATRRSKSPPHHPRNFRGPRTPSPDHN